MPRIAQTVNTPAPTVAAPLRSAAPKHIPVLFSAEMMRALLSGQKTQTRRLASSPLAKAKPGDLLWTREAFRTVPCFDHVSPGNLRPDCRVNYEAAPATFGDPSGKLRPSIYMPRWMSRATLRVTEKRIQPLQDITNADARAEGTIAYLNAKYGGSGTSPRDGFVHLWNSLHGQKPGEAWHNNPDVVALTFEVLKTNIDSIGDAP